MICVAVEEKLYNKTYNTKKPPQEIGEVFYAPYLYRKEAIMGRGLAYKRHQEQRIKEKVKKYHVCHDPNDPSVVGQVAETPARCSCYMCGNPRKYFNKRTLQEEREMQEEISSYI